tara:strand:+ start:823 stop:1104 length:282 start_codon:yes stop_codon:yes gene_type:complete
MSTRPRHKNGNGWFDARLRQYGGLLFSSNARNTFCAIVVFIKQTIFSFSISIFFKNFSAGYFSIQQCETSNADNQQSLSFIVRVEERCNALVA